MRHSNLISLNRFRGGVQKRLLQSASLGASNFKPPPIGCLTDEQKVLFLILARLLPFLLFFLFGARAMAADVLVVQDAPLKVFEQFRYPFLDELSAATSATGPKQILPYETEVVNLTDFASDSATHAAIERLSPHLIVALGQKAFEYAARAETAPLIYALVAAPDEVSTSRTDITGISLNISPDRQLDLFTAYFSFEKLGMVYSTEHGAPFEKKAKKAAVRHGIKIVSSSIDQVKEAPGVFKSMENKIDALWLIPDTTVLTRSTMEYLAYFSLKNKIPIFSFSEKLLDFGAAAGISIDLSALGRQTADMAIKLLDGTPASRIPVEEPARIELQINRTIVRTLGIRLKRSLRQTHSEGNR
jgi:putative ABC transport system substrate-binding protein